MVLKAPRSYFCGLEDLNAARTNVQQPDNTKIIGKINVQSVITCAA
jgi:hypothetical protein